MTKPLQHELKKKHPFALPSQEAMLNLLRTSDQFQNRFLRLFREYGLTPSQYNVLRILRGEDAPLPSLEIAARMIQVVPAITGLLDRLEQQSLVRRTRDPKDRRVVYVELTAAAKKLLAKLDQPVLDLHEQLLSPLSKSEQKELSRLLSKARSGLEPVPSNS